MTDVEVVSKPSSKVVHLHSRQIEAASRQNFPDLGVTTGTHPEGQLLTTLSFIEFELPSEALVTLQLFDVSGEELSKPLHDAPLHAGTHQLTFSTENGAGAARLYRLSVKSEGRVYVDVKRLR